MKKALKFFLPKLLWVLVLSGVVQYYLVFPGAFADLPASYQASHPQVAQGWITGDKSGSKYLYYDSGNEESDLVVFFHGNYETIDQNFRPIVNLTNREQDVLLVEYPGYGDSHGWPMPEKIIATTETALAKFHKPGQNLIIWGRSLGGALAVEMARRHSPRALILESTFLHPLNALGNDILTTLLTPLFVLDLNTQSKLSDLDPALPVLLLHGDSDHLFDVAISHKMKREMTNMPVTQVIYPGGHNARNYPLDTIINFLAKH